MKNIKRIHCAKFTLFVILLMTVGCTDLDEELFSSADGANFFTNDTENQLGLASVYAATRFLTNNNNFTGLQVSADDLMIPVRGADWLEGNNFVEMTTHTWNANHPFCNGAWSSFYRVIARANTIIEIIEEIGDLSDSQKVALAEAKALRAFSYLHLLDLFGRPALVTEAKIDPNNLAANATPQVIFDFVETELIAAIQDLPAVGSLRGFVDKDVARAMLTNLYLNAESYTGTARWSDVISVANDLINSGQHSLVTGGLANNWGAGNQSSTENIWVQAASVGASHGNNWPRRMAHYNQGNSLDVPGGGWNGYCTIADFYNTFEDGDARKTAWMLEGQQYEKDGATMIMTRQGTPLDFTLDFPDLFITGDIIESAGVRPFKYNSIGTTPVGNEFDFDFVIYTLAEIVLAKAEAQARLGQNTEAATTMNPIRERAGIAPLASATIEDVFNERGRELAFGITRRTDMIRHGKFTTTIWKFKTNNESHRRVFPIPQAALDVNSNLTQNSGY